MRTSHAVTSGPHLVRAVRADALLRAARGVDVAFRDWSARLEDPDDELYDLVRCLEIAGREVRALTARLTPDDLVAILDRVCGKTSRAAANLDLWHTVAPRDAPSDRELRAALAALAREADAARRELRRGATRPG